MPGIRSEGLLDVSFCFLQHVGVTTAKALQRLGMYVTRRRVDCGYRERVAFARHIGLSDRALADIEKGVRAAGASTYALLEQGLGWRAGSIKSVIAGGEPTEDTVAAVDAQPLSSASIDDLLGEIRRRFFEIRRVAGNQAQDSRGIPAAWLPDDHPGVVGRPGDDRRDQSGSG